MSLLGIVLFAIIEIAETLLIPWHASRRISNSASTAV
jgi:NitT/TauT family transport system permease protein